MRHSASGGLVSAGNMLRRAGVYPFLAGLLGILLLIQLVRLIWLVATPLGPVGGWQANEVRVLSPQSRLSLFGSFDPFFRNNQAAGGNVVTSLQLTLYGVRMNSGSGLGSAILAGPDGVQESYAVGDEIMDGVSLASVAFDHVTIDRGGVQESLYLDQSIPAETVGAELKTTVEPEELPMPAQALSASASAAMADAVRFSPRSEDGKITGIVVASKGDDAMFRSAGFRDGDVVTAVNGRKISSAADIEALQSQIAQGSRLSIELERGADGDPATIDLSGL